MKAPQKVVVYARLADNVGNVTIINSDGMVIYNDIKTTVIQLNYTKLSNKDASVSYDFKGNTFKELLLDDVVLRNNVDYTINGNWIYLKSSYLDTLAAGLHTVKTTCYPLGVTETPKAGSDAPYVESLGLYIKKATPAVEVVVNPTNHQVRPGSVTLSANLPAGATGTLQYWVNNEKYGDPVPVGQSVTLSPATKTTNLPFWWNTAVMTTINPSPAQTWITTS
ncbi:MAG: hypothetical protein BWY72_02467 [Bacteroidetes bacterium ADurb.Bin416]|nr:MAG: hypothetical protein BWY72_02467 [Bacteroidetes bacterium ADurb.Bin416]